MNTKRTKLESSVDTSMIPSEIWAIILVNANLTIRDVSIAAIICKRWNKAIQSEQFWECKQS